MSLFSKKEKSVEEVPEVCLDGVSEGADVVTEEQIDAVMKKYDRESNTRIWTGVPHLLVTAIMSLFSLYCIWSTLFNKAPLEVRLTAFLGCVIVMGYLYYPASKQHVRPNYMPWYDIVIMVVGAACFFYYCFSYASLARILTSASKMSEMQILIGVVGLLTMFELCRRCVGVPILCVLGALLIYTFVIGLPLRRLIYTLFYSTGGVIGTPAQVCAKFIVVFIVFGSFLERTGISKFFIDLANKIAGWSSGGPAKVAVISSALCGMVSGSSVGNTVTTGSVTIPMMKKTGYKPEFAGAVEAAASTGGQIMPPIMGAAAFLMAEYMGIPYGQVALKAILPAVLYFSGIFISVHLEAKKLGLKGLDRKELMPAAQLFARVYLLAPLLYSFFGVAVMRCDLRSAALFWLPMYLLTTFGIPLFSGQTRTVGWSMFYESCLTPFLLIPVIRESLGIRQREFKVTDKSGSRDWRWWMVIPHAFACLILAAAVVCSVRLSLEAQSFQYVMLVLWNVYHLYLAFAGILFVLNCKKSKSESLKEELPHRLSGRELAALKLPRLLASLLK